MSRDQIEISIGASPTDGGQGIANPEQLPDVYHSPDRERPASRGDLQVVDVRHISCAVMKQSYNEKNVL